MMPTCDTCRFWSLFREDADGKPLHGHCRRHAPQREGWPVTYNDAWCGDHEDSSARGIEPETADV